MLTEATTQAHSIDNLPQLDEFADRIGVILFRRQRRRIQVLMEMSEISANLERRWKFLQGQGDVDERLAGNRARIFLTRRFGLEVGDHRHTQQANMWQAWPEPVIDPLTETAAARKRFRNTRTNWVAFRLEHASERINNDKLYDWIDLPDVPRRCQPFREKTYTMLLTMLPQDHDGLPSIN